MANAPDSDRPPATQFPGFQPGTTTDKPLGAADARARARDLGLEKLANTRLDEVIAAYSVARALSARLPRVEGYDAEPAHAFGFGAGQ
ncbi:hypothetical protein CLV47_115100 [Antricoccus suffuscus]|uniref:Uncharacterized protein n=1 Tax=Antricoccus suffuscus TaxID=1629062 RepID=A0A2T0ZWE5_9ACTN|nr:hypothetical protein [Antricoccus suffuscus]PRZ40672.1 hypothetical protein CLV47_115100 [Antricoccus suffuscus]